VKNEIVDFSFYQHHLFTSSGLRLKSMEIKLGRQNSIKFVNTGNFENTEIAVRDGHQGGSKSCA